MNKFRKYLILLVLVGLANCTHKSRMGLNHFNFDDKPSVAVAKVNLIYDGKKIPMDSRTCFVNFYDEDSKVVFLKYRVNGDYIFMNTDANAVYLREIRRSSYRVFYNKARTKTLVKRMDAGIRKGKFNYLGDIDIRWTPQIFKISDLFNMGALGQDHGSFSMRVRDNYHGYLDFMRRRYGFDGRRSVDSLNRSLTRQVHHVR